MGDYDWLVVGAGLTGATFAERIASQHGKRVLVIDRRPHVAGNAFDYLGNNGIVLHAHGPHIFHTNSDKVWNYLSRFTSWRPYRHFGSSLIDNREIPIPFSLDSLALTHAPKDAERIEKKLIDSFGEGQSVPVLKLRLNDDADLRHLGEFVYEAVFVKYCQKLWGLRPESLSPSVTARLPVTIARNVSYFPDRYQAMPRDGYEAMFKRMLDHPNITVLLNTEFDSVRDIGARCRVLYTGQVDRYFDFAFGMLPYRSVRFQHDEFQVEWFQEAGSVSHPDADGLSRTTEMKRLSGQQSASTIICGEYPEAHREGLTEPYYPIPSADTDLLLRPYKVLAESHRDKVLFAGRLGDYAYYNMDQACGRALALFERQQR